MGDTGRPAAAWFGPKSEFDRLRATFAGLGRSDLELVPADDQAQVIIRSTNPINDLALEFLLELYSPNSRIVKAYSLLFDPPEDAAPMPLSDQIIEVGQRTLWSIAREVKPEGADINQTMLALLNTNPDVFERQNINGLIPVLACKYPMAEALASIPAPLAKQLVEQQHEDWAMALRRQTLRWLWRSRRLKRPMQRSPNPTLKLFH